MEISITLLRELLSYDPESGSFTWLRRHERHFRHPSYCGRWNGRFAGKRAMTIGHGNGYLSGRLFNRNVYAHRVAYAIYHGHWPTAQIDHINGNRMDNRIANLRDVSAAENSKNKRMLDSNSSGIVGVSFNQGKWVAMLGKRHIGRFATIEGAAEARRQAEITAGYHENHGRIAA